MMVDGDMSFFYGLLTTNCVFLLMIAAMSCGLSFVELMLEAHDIQLWLGSGCGGLSGQPCPRWRERVELWCYCCQSWSVDSADFPRLWVRSQEERLWTTDWVVQLCHSWRAISPKDRVQRELNHTDGPCKPKNVHRCCAVTEPLWWLEDTNQVPCCRIIVSILFQTFPVQGLWFWTGVFPSCSS